MLGGTKQSYLTPQEAAKLTMTFLNNNHLNILWSRNLSCVIKMYTGRILRPKSSPDNGLLEGDGIRGIKDWREF